MKICILLPAVFLAVAPFAGASEIAVSFAVGKKPKTTIAFPAVVVKESEGHVRKEAGVTRDFRFPSRWDLPTIPKDPSQPVLPVTPTSFEVYTSGWTILFTAEQMKDGLVRISGTATFSDLEPISRTVYGEFSAPIHAPGNKKAILTPNESPAAISHVTTTPFQVFALPDTSYKVKIKEGQKATTLYVRYRPHVKTAKKS